VAIVASGYRRQPSPGELVAIDKGAHRPRSPELSDKTPWHSLAAFLGHPPACPINQGLARDVPSSRDRAVILINQLSQIEGLYIDTIDRRTFGGNCGDVPIVRALRDAQLDGPHRGYDRAGTFRAASAEASAIWLKVVRCDLGADPASGKQAACTPLKHCHSIRTYRHS
jgi:hypothetical protein